MSNAIPFKIAPAFIAGGGERGPQMALTAPGSYRINPFLFSVQLADALDIPDNKVGIVTTREGFALSAGEIAGPVIDGHNMFQSPQVFVDGKGCKGLQEQVLLAGRYFINPSFATIELVDMTEVPIAHVGVVIAYVGKEGADVSGEAFRHGNLVNRGDKGVWVDPLDPGKYPINPYTHKVTNVPTANVVLNWATGKTEAHQARCQPVDDYRPIGRRLQIQPGCLANHPYSAQRRAQGHRSIRQHVGARHPGARSDHWQLLSKRRARFRQHGLLEKSVTATGRGPRFDFRGAQGVQRRRSGYPERRHRIASCTDEDPD